MTEYATKKEAHEAGITEGIRQATEAHRLGVDLMDPARLARAAAKMVVANGGDERKFSPGALMVGTVSPMEFAVELARHYNAERPS